MKDRCGFWFEEAEFKSRRGIALFTCSWIPSCGIEAAKALVFLCHGYGVECSVFMREAGERLAASGYAVYGLDYEGHGRSPGRRCYIRRFHDIVDDCDDFFDTVLQRHRRPGQRAFLYGESMGGAVALLLEQRRWRRWDGAVLLAPMCKISENMLPRPWLRWVLIQLSALIPTWRIVPTKDVIDESFKDEAKRAAIRSSPYIYKGRMLLRTAVELLLTSLQLESTLGDVSFPFLVLHGGDDVVTDPEVSRQLYAAAASDDKSIRIYDGMWHGLTSGEPDHNVDIVFKDITAWLDARCTVAAPAGQYVDVEPGVKYQEDEGVKKMEQDGLGFLAKLKQP